MRQILAVVTVAVIVAILAVPAGAKDMTKMKAVGWHDQNAPIGGAIWVSEKIGVQAGIGFNKPDEGDTEIDIVGAVPIVVAGTDRANFMFRPGVFFASKPGGSIDSFISVRGDLAVEVFLADRFSIVGGHGIELVSTSFDTGNTSAKTTLRNQLSPLESRTDIQTRTISSSSVGFYFYFPG